MLIFVRFDCSESAVLHVMSVFQLRSAMVQGETGTLCLDVRTPVDKGVSTFVCQEIERQNGAVVNFYLFFLNYFLSGLVVR